MLALFSTTITIGTIIGIILIVIVVVIDLRPFNDKNDSALLSDDRVEELKKDTDCFVLLEDIIAFKLLSTPKHNAAVSDPFLDILNP